MIAFRRPSLRLRLFVTAAALAVTAACGSTEPQAVPIEQTTFADTLHIDLARFTRLSSGMYVRDSVVGSGATLASGHAATVRYVGYFPNGVVFDNNVAPKPLFTFTPGAGQVIPGWDIGIPGMKVGGKRILIIPPELAYGASGQGAIPPYAVIVFTVDAISTQ